MFVDVKFARLQRQALVDVKFACLQRQVLTVVKCAHICNDSLLLLKSINIYFRIRNVIHEFEITLISSFMYNFICLTFSQTI